jgi:tetratricopeptide (TPR) repeat protein
MALEHLRPAVELTRAIGYRPGELSAMTALGDAQRLLDRHEHAAATYQYALAVAEEIATATGSSRPSTALAGYITRSASRNARWRITWRL